MKDEQCGEIVSSARYMKVNKGREPLALVKSREIMAMEKGGATTNGD